MKMKTLFDTSVLVAAIVEPHPMHTRALAWFQRAKAGKIDFLVVTHTLAELYVALTTIPLKPKISPSTAWRLVHDNVETSAKIVSLSSSDYKDTVKHMSELGIFSINRGKCLVIQLFWIPAFAGMTCTYLISSFPRRRESRSYYPNLLRSY